MDNESLLKKYVGNAEFMAEYIRYQERYFPDARKSDLVFLGLVEKALARRDPAQCKLLDIGCSTGALLYHLRCKFPTLGLNGADMSEVSIAACRDNPKLKRISFYVMDICRLPPAPDSYDIVTVNAVLFLLGRDLFAQALAGIAGMLKPGGTLLAFDFFHPHRHDIDMVEYSKRFPHGQPIHMRAFESVERFFDAAGFAKPNFLPFEIPIDLHSEDLEPIQTRTETTADGRHLQFRGAIHQPWCHLAARKP